MSIWSRVSRKTKLYTLATLLVCAGIGALVAWVVIPEQRVERKLTGVEIAGPCRAALGRGGLDAVIRDPECRTQSRLIVTACLAQRPCRLALLRALGRDIAGIEPGDAPASAGAQSGAAAPGAAQEPSRSPAGSRTPGGQTPGQTPGGTSEPTQSPGSPGSTGSGGAGGSSGGSSGNGAGATIQTPALPILGDPPDVCLRPGRPVLC